MSTLKMCAATIGIAGALAIGTMSPTLAAPLASGGALIKAAPGQVTDVAWRGGGRGGFTRGGFARGGFRGGRGAGVVAGVAAGALVGAAIANSGPGYYEPQYYAGPLAVAYDPAYAYGPDDGYAPGYYDPSCATDDGYGRMRPCEAQ